MGSDTVRDRSTAPTILASTLEIGSMAKELDL